LLATVRPRDAAGKARRRVAAELIADLERIYKRKKAADKELKELVAATGTSLMDLHGMGPSGTARLLVEVGDITRFATRAHFASWNGTAPIDASSGDQVRHRLSRAGNRQINRVLHIMATVQLRTAPKDAPNAGRRQSRTLVNLALGAALSGDGRLAQQWAPSRGPVGIRQAILGGSNVG
jgi:transposase